MNIQILHSWLLEYLDTNATPAKIGEYLSLCGPSVEKIEKKGNDWMYDIEVTTNRVDMMSVYGIAREAAVVLPQFGIKATLKKLDPKAPQFPKTSLPLIIKSNDQLVKRTMGVIFTDIKNWKTPEWMKTRLEASGIRSLNAVIDITNYVMTEVGHPTHVFDYDNIKTQTLVIRESKKQEKIITLDNKAYTLPVGSIVIDDGTGEIIDLPGIMGTKNTVVNDNTKQVLFFIDNNDPIKIRKTSMTTGIRTVAATLNEKGVDPELAEKAMLRGIELFIEVTGATIASKIYDHSAKKYIPKTITLSKSFIDERLGVEVSKTRIEQILTDLDFEVKWEKGKRQIPGQARHDEDLLTVSVPSIRAQDITIAEDVVEEVARIYGYHNLPSELMTGKIPEPLHDAPFQFELKAKRILQMLSGVEIYTMSLVSQNEVDPKNALKIRNPLGSDNEYMRTSLAPSLVKAAKENNGEKESFHLFEMANVYLPKKRELPEEKVVLAGILGNTSFRQAKGIVESLLDQLHIDYTFEIEDAPRYIQNTRLKIISNKKEVGRFGQLENGGFLYYQFDVEQLQKTHKPMPAYIEIPKYPAQVEDITLSLNERIKVGEVIETIKATNSLVSSVELTDIYENAYTFRVWYQDLEKTLTDKEVEEVRTKILAQLKSKFGVTIKG
jgi:phenylalanyl-tRNA synthetase beta chain